MAATSSAPTPTAAGGGDKPPLPPRPVPPSLPLSQSEDGSLAVAPLSAVINAATDALYRDLYALVHGEVEIATVAGGGGGDGAEGTGGGGTSASGSGADGSAGAGGGNAAASVEEKLTAAALGVEKGGGGSGDASGGGGGGGAPSTSAGGDAVLETRKQKMANLSFAQRRHELSRRVVRHAKSLAHVHALTAASIPKGHAAVVRQRALRGQHPPPSRAPDPPPRLGATVQASSDALKFVKSGWVAQDEAQDALYFHHDGLWKARAHCHDVLGALCVISTPAPGEAGGEDGEEDGGADDDADGKGDAMEVDAEEAKPPPRSTVAAGGGRWPDFPSDVALAVDRYETSEERSLSPSELRARLVAAVRRKLVLGEVGAHGTTARGGDAESEAPKAVPEATDDRSGRRGDDASPLPWRVVLEPGGGSVRLTHGAPRTASTAEALRRRALAEEDGGGGGGSASLEQYPMEARLSVLSESPDAPWKLLSVRVRCSPKTGESDHQLAMNKKQMFDLHRIGERAMLVEEAVCRKANEARRNADAEGEETEGVGGERGNVAIVPRPLLRLFEVTHAFALSLQMEVLSSQAEALRRGAWGGGIAGASAGGRSRPGGGEGAGIAVSPAHFFDARATGGGTKASDGGTAPIAVMAVHFWSCDDRHGSPRVGDLHPSARAIAEVGGARDDASTVASSRASGPNFRRDDNYLPRSDRRGEGRLSLCVRAVPTVGLVVSLSGGGGESDATTMTSGADNEGSAVDRHVRRNADKLLSSIRDPFQLSMSDALLAATVLCADRRCRAVVGALERRTEPGARLPRWMRLEVECGTVSVAASSSYATSSSSSAPVPPAAGAPAVLFRLACDSRTGRFVPAFPRAATLLRRLVCNDMGASDVQLLRAARAAAAAGGGKGSDSDAASLSSAGRAVRDAFEALSRSADALGRRCGVGGEWNDVDPAHSASLRERSIGQTCSDVRASLMTCCGVAAAFGVGAMALRIAGGVDPVVDMAGGPIIDESCPDIVPVPPLAVILRQRIVEKLVKEGIGETKRISQLQGELLALAACVNEETLELVCFDVLTSSESASSVPTRLKHAKVNSPEVLQSPPFSEADLKRPTKKARTEVSSCRHTLEEVEYATLWLDALLRQ
ncbi:hypothetical protein ACHAWF_008525 [Thalassiosira exigua]